MPLKKNVALKELVCGWDNVGVDARPVRGDVPCHQVIASTHAPGLHARTRWDARALSGQNSISFLVVSALIARLTSNLLASLE
jgi:hypothetical protein